MGFVYSFENVYFVVSIRHQSCASQILTSDTERKIKTDTEHYSDLLVSSCSNWITQLIIAFSCTYRQYIDLSRKYFFQAVPALTTTLASGVHPLMSQYGLYPLSCHIHKLKNVSIYF